MGLFLQTVIIPNCKESTAIAAIEKAESISYLDLVVADCNYIEINGGVSILLNDGCCGYDELAKKLSSEIKQPVMLLYIYDEDYWGYYFYDNGAELDIFNPMPNYFEEVSSLEKEKLAGSRAIISKYFAVNESEIKNYLVTWTDEYIDDYEQKAYESDEFGQCNCWQMADFMAKIGYPYEW